MKKFLKISTIVLRILCGLFLIWYVLYFLFGDRLALRFSNREFASVFTQILVFAAAVSVYGLFILYIRSNQKKWINILLFVGGLIVGCIPLLLYHGYLQYRCGFWNMEQISEKMIFDHLQNPDETVQIIHSKCKTGDLESVDTLYIKKTGTFLDWTANVNFEKSEKGDWISR
ncbi:MAG: hypothetical protein WBF83_05445 [Moheibacter sp.]